MSKPDPALSSGKHVLKRRFTLGFKDDLKRELKIWLWAFLAAAPFLAAYLVHFLKLGSSATGFLQGDMPFYAANARAIIERGNGFCYPNPYDIDLHSPAIYFHLQFFVFSIALRIIRMDIGYLYALVGMLLGVLLSRMTLTLVRARVRDQRNTIPLFFAAMWGGGLLTIGALISQSKSVASGYPFNPLQYDTDAGTWLVLWSRNMFFTQEAFYHVLVTGIVIALIKQRWWIGAALCAALAASHPWTTLQIFGGLSLWMMLCLIFERKKLPPLGFMLLFVLTGASFLWYYAVYLPSFWQYREIQALWHIPYVLSNVALVLKLSIVAVVAGFYVLRVIRGKRRFEASDTLLGSLLIVTLTLVKHDLFMHPTQPIHFDRGYPWMFLFLFATPYWEHLIGILRDIKHKDWKTKTWGFVLGAALTGLLLLDNIAYLSAYYNPDWNILGIISLRPQVRQIYEEANLRHLQGVVAGDEEMTMLLAPAYTGMIPYTGNSTLSRHAEEGQKAITAAFVGKGTPEFPKEVRYLICHLNAPAVQDVSRWHLEFVSNGFGLFYRK